MSGRQQRKPIQRSSQAALLEAEATLRAIRTGEVDAVVIDSAEGPRIYSLHRNDQAYRSIVEHMSEGAVAVDGDGLILYCNRRFAGMLGTSPEALLAQEFQSLVAPADLRRFHRLMEAGRATPAAVELVLMPSAGPLAVYVSSAPIEMDGTPCLAMVVTDLSARVRSEMIAASQEFARSLLDQVTEPVFIVDHDGIVTHASHVAQMLWGSRVLGHRFTDLLTAAEGASLDGLVERALAGELVQGLEVVLDCDVERRFLGSGGPLRDAHARIVGCVVSLVDITALKSLQGELEQARDQALAAKAGAERANVSKSKFLASASHDLRQPMQSLLLFHEVLQPHVAPKGQTAFKHLGRGLDALRDLLDSLLDISRLDAGIVQPVIEDFPVRDLIEPIGAAYGPIAVAKGLALRAGDSPAVVRSDRTLLGRMVRNLVENALRYTEAGHIVIECHGAADHLRIAVADTGIGIPPEHLDWIWEEFHQVGNPERDRNRGLGLGLAIVQRLSHLLAHPVGVRSTPGTGSEFSIEVPLGRSAPVHAPPPAVKVAGNGRFAVLVDDDAIVLLGLKATFEGWGYEVLAAGSADQALARLRERGQRPDIVVSDYRLREGRSGTEAILRIRESFGAGIPGVVLTGETGSEVQQDALEHGLHVIHKPVTPRQLGDVLEGLFAGR